MIDTTRILLGLVISSGIGALAYRRGSLSKSGWLGAIITGTTTFGFGGWAHGITLVAFFVSSTLLSRWRKRHKQHLEHTVFEKGSQRDIWQALANGGVGSAICLCMPIFPDAVDLFNALYVGAMATVAADTWATELGVLSRNQPRLITTFASVARGTSGAISGVGTLATAAGALAMGVVFSVSLPVSMPILIVAGSIGGLIGSLSDSLMGATVQRLFATAHGPSERRFAADGSEHTLIRGWMWLNNDMVNFLSSLCGAGVALLIWLV
ncbi:MAG: DUF92 domain-containing protein [Chloroflexi bacterium]|nr:DUF92 domain-containing protein [Chloroflexota bacterium]